MQILKGRASPAVRRRFSKPTYGFGGFPMCPCPFLFIPVLSGVVAAVIPLLIRAAAHKSGEGLTADLRLEEWFTKRMEGGHGS